MDKRAILFIALVTVAFYGINQWFSKQKATQTTQWIQEQKTQEVISDTAETIDEPPPVSSLEEEFYVLQNDYQQLVFSTRGGALAEINLVLHSEENEQSPIYPIQIDKRMEQDYSQNDYFPSHAYNIVRDQGKERINRGQLGGYYPLIRRSIFNSDGTIYKAVNPKFYSLNIISDDNSTASGRYSVTRFEKDLIQFEISQPQRRITKTFSLPQDPKAPYAFTVRIQVDGDRRNLRLSSGIPEVELISGKYTPSLKYQMDRGNKPAVEQIKLPSGSSVVTSILPTWVSNSNGFFGLIINPLSEIGQGYQTQKVAGTLVPPRISLIDPQYQLYPAQNYPGYEVSLPLGSSSLTREFRVYAGPYEGDYLQLADKVFSDPTIGYTPNYIGAQSFHGWFAFISEPFAKFLFLLMEAFHRVTHSWGLSIILLTIVLRLMLYPLNAWSIKANARMQEIAPLAKTIQEKYKKDPKRAQMEVMKLYQEKKANPFMGCFPILIQMPFLIGMFDLLKSTFELRGAVFIPGWIDNLTAPDVLFSWNYPILFFGTQFHLLPILLGLVMYLQQRFTSKLPKDKSKWTDQQKQQRMIGTIMAVFFTFLFYKFPSGLNIYWLSSSLLGILQQWYNTKKMKKTPTALVSSYYSKKGKKT